MAVTFEKTTFVVISVYKIIVYCKEFVNYRNGQEKYLLQSYHLKKTIFGGFLPFLYSVQQKKWDNIICAIMHGACLYSSSCYEIFIYVTESSLNT